MARDRVKQGKYQYLKEGNKLYRYPYVAEVKDYDYIGEEFDPTHLKWIKSSATMGVKMAGHGVIVTETSLINTKRPRVPATTNKAKKTSTKR